MPQMSPMWWSPLFMTFIITLVVIIMMIYTFKIYILKDKKNYPKNKKYINWMW
uniref:ATPase subunit 8 n=1 Tax=Lasiolabops cosmopolites TaxID=2813038 RepID=A0A8T9ZYP9_9HEMI|nr:ATPase subunit 8 [Lasiolabops cosmopolites]